MNTPHNRVLTNETFFVTSNLRNREPIFADPMCAKVALDSLQFFRKRGEIELYGYVIMPDHVHAVIKVVAPTTLPVVMRRFKSFVAHELSRGPIWQERYASAILPTKAILEQKLEYMHRNPVRKGMVSFAVDYEWSSASEWTENRRGTIDYFCGSERLSADRAEPGPMNEEDRATPET